MNETAPAPSTKASRVTCQGCGGVGGKHKDLRCPFLGLALERQAKAQKGGSR